ncbi:MAG: hypothetical protein LC624_11450 [Halobacteriales archaeon]|nr:hypothetical protein [Halobacteriales archaeon]
MYSTSAPPKYVPYTRPVPAGLTLATKPSQEPPPCMACMAFAVGRSVDCVYPAKRTLPALSTPMPPRRSADVPP